MSRPAFFYRREIRQQEQRFSRAVTLANMLKSGNNPTRNITNDIPFFFAKTFIDFPLNFL